MRPKPNPQAPYVLGVDIGGTKLAVVLATRDGQMLHKERLPTEADKGPAVGVARLISMIRHILSGVEDLGGREAVAGIGIACGSPMDAERGIILGPPNLQTWNPVPIVDLLEQEFGLYACLENDANAGALAEWRFGAGRGKRSVVYMTMGTGIGGGLVLDGRLYRGANGNAGEVGHMRVTFEGGPLCGCGKRGCLEAYCSGPAIARRAREELARARSRSRAARARARRIRRQPSWRWRAASRPSPPNTSLPLPGREIRWPCAWWTRRPTCSGWGWPTSSRCSTRKRSSWAPSPPSRAISFLDRVRRAARAETWPQLFEVVDILPSPLGSQVGDYGAISVLLQALDADNRSSA